MLPHAQPLDYKYFTGTRRGFVGSIYGDGNTGLYFKEPYQIYLDEILKVGNREQLIDEMKLNYTSTNLYLNKSSFSRYVENEKNCERQARLYNPLFGSLFVKIQGQTLFPDDFIESGQVFDIQTSSNRIFIRQLCSILYKSFRSGDFNYTVQPNKLTDMLPDPNKDIIYLGIENYYMKVFDLENNRKVASYNFKSLDITPQFRFCQLQNGCWDSEILFMNEKYLYSVDTRDKKASKLIELSHLKFFGLKKVNDLMYVSIDSDGVNIYDIRMFSTPIKRRNHEFRDLAPKLYDALFEKNEIIAIVGTHSYPSIKMVEFELLENHWSTNYNMQSSDIYPFLGDQFAFYDDLENSHLKLLSAGFESSNSVILCFNDNSRYRASISRDRRIIKRHNIGGSVNVSNNFENDEAIQKDEISYQDKISLDFKNKANGKPEFLRPKSNMDMMPDSTNIETFPWDTIHFQESELKGTILEYPGPASDMICKFSYRFNQMLNCPKDKVDAAMFMETSFVSPPTLTTVKPSTQENEAEPKKKKKKRGFL
eukprot:NODE_494_length_6830_cov_0.941613.p2 type:complete len:538 gc:universal NODE_494_length_6830_cov_0.941613:4830-3217(-)